MEEIVSKHIKRVEALGYSEEQARDIIHRMSAIMSAFVDAAWGVHPAQLSVKARDNKQLSDDAECDRIEQKSRKMSEIDTTVSPEEQ